jgi:mRNA interferase YafQ
MLRADFTTSFVRDRKRCRKKHWSIAALDEAITAVMASDEVPLSPRFHDHALSGQWSGYRALHIQGSNSNWVLLYQIVDDEVFFIATGTHDEVYE